MVPSWIVFGLICFWGLVAVSLGVMGFSPGGIPLTRNTRLTGMTGKITGVPCILLGLAILWIASHSILGPAEDSFAKGFVQALPYGVAVYALARLIWFSRSQRYEAPPRPRRAKRKTQTTSSREVGGIVECPHCGRSMVDTAAELCRFCGKELPPL